MYGCCVVIAWGSEQRGSVYANYLFAVSAHTTELVSRHCAYYMFTVTQPHSWFISQMALQKEEGEGKDCAMRRCVDRHWAPLCSRGAAGESSAAMPAHDTMPAHSVVMSSRLCSNMQAKTKGSCAFRTYPVGRCTHFLVWFFSFYPLITVHLKGTVQFHGNWTAFWAFGFVKDTYAPSISCIYARASYRGTFDTLKHLLSLEELEVVCRCGVIFGYTDVSFFTIKDSLPHK